MVVLIRVKILCKYVLHSQLSLLQLLWWNAAFPSAGGQIVPLGEWPTDALLWHLFLKVSSHDVNPEVFWAVVMQKIELPYWTPAIWHSSKCSLLLLLKLPGVLNVSALWTFGTWLSLDRMMIQYSFFFLPLNGIALPAYWRCRVASLLNYFFVHLKSLRLY